MKKNLRFMFTALLMMFGMTAMAEDIIWSEDWSSVTEFKVDPNGINANYTFTGTTFKDDGTYKGGTAIYDEALAGGEAPELLVAKNGGTFAAKVALNGKSGEMMLAYKCNKAITVTVDGATLGENTGAGNDYVYPVTVAAGTQEITITFTNSLTQNARLDNIKLYQGTAKKPAGLSWGKGSTTLYIGEEVTLTLSNENNLPVTYDSSNKEAATIDAQGVITLVAEGKTTLSAAFAGNDEYEAQTVSIEVTVKQKEQGGGGETTTINVAKALEIIAGLDDNGKTTEEYDVEGFVVAVDEWSPKPDGYGNATFDISDEAGNTTSVLKVFRAKNAEGQNFTTDDTPLAVGEKVTVRGQLQKYVKNGVTTPEVATNGKVIARSTLTAINTVKAANEQGVVYNLQGQQVMQPTKGLYIINGKKVVIK